MKVHFSPPIGRCLLRIRWVQSTEQKYQALPRKTKGDKSLAGSKIDWVKVVASPGLDRCANAAIHLSRGPNPPTAE